MLNKDLRAWLAARLTSGTPVVGGPAVPDIYTGRVVVLTPAPGAGFTDEMLFDTPGVQARCIGDQYRGDSEAALDDVDELAAEVDRAFLVGPWPPIGGMHVVRIQRFGGGPSPDRLDDAERTHMVATYMIEVQSGY